MKGPTNDQRERRRFTAAQKAAIVKAHLVDGKSVADLCDERRIQPTQFYQWQKQLFENAEAAFERQGKPGKKSPDSKIASQRIVRKRSRPQHETDDSSEPQRPADSRSRRGQCQR